MNCARMMYRGRDEDLAVKAVRIGPRQEIEMQAGAQLWQESEIRMEARCNGIRFYVDESFDGYEVEYLESAYWDQRVQDLCRDLGVPCRRI